MAAKPTVPAQLFDFSGHTAANPTDPQPGVSLDAEYTQHRTTEQAILDWVATFLADNGTPKNKTVDALALADDAVLFITSGWRYRGVWQPNTSYLANDFVENGGAGYVALADHTSDAATFANDIASWGRLFTVSGHEIEVNTSPATQRSLLNFAGEGVTLTDDAGNDRTTVNIGVAGYEEGSLIARRGRINFVGAGATVTDDGSHLIVTIPGDLTSVAMQPVTQAVDLATARAAMGLAIGSDVQAHDPDILKRDQSANLTVGFTISTFNHGSLSTGTLTLNLAQGQHQKVEITGDCTIAAPSGGDGGNIDLKITMDPTGNHTVGLSGFEGSLTTGQIDATPNAVNILRLTRIDGQDYVEIVNVGAAP